MKITTSLIVLVLIFSYTWAFRINDDDEKEAQLRVKEKKVVEKGTNMTITVLNSKAEGLNHKRSGKPTDKIEKDIKKIDKVINNPNIVPSIKTKPELNSKPITNISTNSKINEKKIQNKKEESNIVSNILKPQPLHSKPSANIHPNLNHPDSVVSNLISPANIQHRPLPRQDLVEFALPEINILPNQRIENYYPYFYKANLIQINSPVLPQETLLPIDCGDPACEMCNIDNRFHCIKCLPGHFNLNGKCMNMCPDNFYADVYARECISLQFRLKNTFSRVTYLKAFSIGSCKNMCGRISSDCSCQKDCLQFGNCCSDYNDCEILIKKNFNRQDECRAKNPNCELCIDFDNPDNRKCGQCKAHLFLRNDECVPYCEAYDRVNKENMTCLKSNKCLVENCFECEQGNPSVCKLCLNGFFLYNNMCNLQCPAAMTADRMHWTCMNEGVFSWFWVFPSRDGCRNKCGIPIGPNRDCSCREDCIRYGNCCQDIEYYCLKFY